MDKRYKPVKKVSEAYHMPLILRNVIEAQLFTSNGIFVGNNGDCSVLYKLESDTVTDSLFDELRGKDCDVDIYEMEDGIYINLIQYLEEFDEAQEQWLLMETDVFDKIPVRRLDFQERMSFIYKYYHPEGFEPIDFTENINEFLPNLKHEPQDLNENSIKIVRKYYRVCFVRSFPQLLGEEAVTTIREMMEDEAFRMKKISLRCVSDYMVACRYKDTYLDWEPTVANSERRGTELAKVMSSTLESEDHRHYTLGSVMFLMQADTKEELEELYRKKTRKYRLRGVNIDYFYKGQTVKYFIPGYDEYDQNRLLKSEFARFLLPGSKKAESEEVQKDLEKQTTAEEGGADNNETV